MKAQQLNLFSGSENIKKKEKGKVSEEVTYFINNTSKDMFVDYQKFK